jgi:V/A-type H+-transporting ATPase subunit E
MALDSVTKEIQASADASVAKIRADQAKEIEAINQQTDAQIAKMKEAQEKKLSAARETLARQERSSAELESKKIVLAKKKEILTQAFESALADLENAPRDQKLALYKRMVESARTVIPDPVAVISPKDGFTAQELGVGSVETDPLIASGIILRSGDGSVEADMQYRVILQGIWDKNLKQISDILFG